MRITELLKKKSVELGIKVPDKEGVIDRLISLMDAGGRFKDTAGYKKGILTGEILDDTAIDEGIAIPYAKVGTVKESGLAAMVVPESADYDAFNGSLTSLPFMIATPVEGADVYLEALSRLSTLLMNPGSKEGLIRAADKDGSLRIIDEMEVERSGAPEEETGQNAKGDTETGAKIGAKTKTGAEASTSSGYRALAVTAYPTGIAHTYMTAENLENTGKKLGIILRTETGDSDGAQNILIGGEIVTTDVIIIAAGKSVEMTRFDRKPVIMVPVAGGIHEAEELIRRAVGDTVPVYRHMGAAGGELMPGGSDDIGRTIYKHLMNGISHIFPFITGRGILIILAFLFGDYSINPADFGEGTPPTAYLKTVGEQAFGMIFPILAGFIVMSIMDRPGLTVGLMAGLITKTGAIFANPAEGGVNAGFLGTLFAGFIDEYIVAGLRKLFSKLPESLEGIKPMLPYPVIGIFLVAMVTTFVNPYMDMINDGLTHSLNGMGSVSRIVPGTVLSGMMSIDMDSPFNKAIYVFGTAQLAEGNFEVMTAVMASGMVSPITITLCTSFFKKKFTAKERQSGIVNYVIGLSFVIEGAIPFTAQDPLHVIPPYIIGSTITGGLSMAFGCTLRASRGGIFVLLTIGNPFIYLATVVVGAAAGCVILGILKKNAEE